MPKRKRPLPFRGKGLAEVARRELSALEEVAVVIRGVLGGNPVLDGQCPAVLPVPGVNVHHPLAVQVQAEGTGLKERPVIGAKNQQVLGRIRAALFQRLQVVPGDDRLALPAGERVIAELAGVVVNLLQLPDRLRFPAPLVVPGRGLPLDRADNPTSVCGSAWGLLPPSLLPLKYHIRRPLAKKHLRGILMVVRK